MILFTTWIIGYMFTFGLCTENGNVTLGNQIVIALFWPILLGETLKHHLKRKQP